MSAIKKVAAYAVYIWTIGIFLSITACTERSTTPGDAQTSAPALAFKSVDITGADYAQNFALPDTAGNTRTIADFKGKVVVVFFGFVQCSDVCPTTMAELAEVKKQLGADGDKLQALFITVDPERDTPQVLAAYMANFDPSFIALRGSMAQTAQVAKAFKVFYKKVEGAKPDNYTVDHTVGRYVFDTQGALRLYSDASRVAGLADDVKLLLKN